MPAAGTAGKKCFQLHILRSLIARIREFLSIGLRVQRPGLPQGDPLTPALQAMAATAPGGKPVSPAGAEVARLIDPLRVRAAFLPTRGSGVAPWRRWIILGTSYRGEGQVRSATRIGLVAHELTHLLQRDLDDPQHWPSGSLRLFTSRRWLGDSTNYMEVLAYIVGSSVELDLLRSGGASASQPLLDRLATLSGGDAANAARYVVKSFSSNAIYRRNHRVEARWPQGRIPPGGWAYWLGQMGFGQVCLDHIRGQAALGSLQFVEPEEVERLLGGARQPG